MAKHDKNTSSASESCFYVVLGISIGCVPPLLLLTCLNNSSDLSHRIQKRELSPDQIYNQNGDKSNFHLNTEYENPPLFPIADISSEGHHQSVETKIMKLSQRKQNLAASSDLNVDNFKSLHSSRALHFKKKILAGVFSTETRVADMYTAAELTWATANLDAHFLITAPNENSPTKRDKLSEMSNIGHMVEFESLAKMCDSVKDPYSWYMMFSDSVYIDTKAVESLLDTLYPDDHITMGASEECNLASGMIFSEAAMNAVCQTVKECKSNDDAASCAQDFLTEQCIPLSKVKDAAISATAESKTRHKRIEDDRQLFYSGIESAQEIYSTHLKVMSKLIQNTKHKLARIEEGLQNVELKYSKTEANEVPQNWFEKADEKSITSARATHQYIDSNGNIAKSNCQSNAKSNTRTTATAFKTAKLMATDELQLANVENSKLSLSLLQSVTSQEMIYEFYYSLLLDSSRANGERRRVDHITMGHKYSALKVESSLYLNVKLSHIFTSLSSSNDLKEVNGFLHTLDEACKEMHNEGCTLTIVCGEKVTEKHLISLNNTIEKFEKKVRKSNKVAVRYISKYALQDFINDFRNDTNFTSVMIHIPVETVFDSKFLLRCHINAQIGKSAYFPIPFKLKVPTAPWKVKKEFTANNGYWLNQHYSTFSIYFEDFLSNLGNDIFRGDFDLQNVFNNIQNSEVQVKLEIYRFPDPDLLVPWHASDCNIEEFSDANSLCSKNYYYKRLLGQLE